MEFVYGVIGALAVLILFFGGGFAGWKLREYVYQRACEQKAKELTESERRQLMDQQEAFRQMQNYNVDVAYGWKPPRPEFGGDKA